MGRNLLDAVHKYTNQVRKHPSIPDRAVLKRWYLSKDTLHSTWGEVVPAPAAGVNRSLVRLTMHTAYNKRHVFEVRNTSPIAQWYVCGGMDAESLTIDHSTNPVPMNSNVRMVRIDGISGGTGAFSCEIEAFEWEDE
jgi:hypothetical protein